MFTKFSVAIWNLLASTKAEFCARLGDIVRDFEILHVYSAITFLILLQFHNIPSSFA